MGPDEVYEAFPVNEYGFMPLPDGMRLYIGTNAKCACVDWANKRRERWVYIFWPWVNRVARIQRLIYQARKEAGVSK